eukprot:136872-Rhodomonas_salina.1
MSVRYRMCAKCEAHAATEAMAYTAAGGNVDGQSDNSAENSDSLKEQVKKVGRDLLTWAKGGSDRVVNAVVSLQEQTFQLIDPHLKRFQESSVGAACMQFMKYAKKLLSLATTLTAVLAILRAVLNFLIKVSASISRGDYEKAAFESTKIGITISVVKLVRKSVGMLARNFDAEKKVFAYDPMKFAVADNILSLIKNITPAGPNVSQRVANYVAEATTLSWAALLLTKEDDIDKLFEKRFGDTLHMALGVLKATTHDESVQKEISHHEGVLQKLSDTVHLHGG